MTGRRSLLVVLIIFAICLSGVGLYYNAVGYDPAEDVAEPVQEIHVTKDLKNSVNLYLHIVHERDGEVIGDFWKENDLILSNYVNITGLTLTGLEDYWNVTDDQGQNAAVNRDHDPQGNSFIAIGTGTNTPGFDNYTLQTETHREKIDDWLIETSGTSYNLTATSFFTFSGAHAITEAGWCVYIEDLDDEVFFTRDTFSAQNVVADDTLAVSIIFEFTGGITDNFGELIANAFYGDESQSTNRPEDTSGDSRSVAGGADNGLWHDGSGKRWEIWIGTSSTAFDLTDYTLGNKVYEDPIVVEEQVIYDVSGADANITVIGYFSIDASYSIYEIGLVTPIDYGASNYVEIMLLREVRGSGYSVDSGDNIAVYVTWVIDQP